MKRLLLRSWTAALVAAAGVAAAAPAAHGFSFRRVTLGSTGGCWPVASTPRERERGLMAVRQPARPMLFTFSQAGSYAFWMEDTPSPLTGVWIGPAQTVIGRWYGVSNTTVTHVPPAPVVAVIEYPPGWPVPSDGALLQVGRRCRSRGAL